METRMAELLPESAELVPKVAAHLLGETDDLTPEEFAAAAMRMLRSLAAERTLILAIEDLHFADPQTIALLEPLGRAMAESAFLLVLTQRDEEVEEGSDLASLPALLAQHSVVETVRVDPLGRDDVEELMLALVGRARTVRALAWPLLRSSAGNPRFLLATLAHLKQTGVLTRANSHWEPTVPVGEVDLPTDLRSLLELKLKDLDDELREPLEAAAVLGVEFAPALVAAVTGVRRIRLLKRLAALERKHRLLVSVGRSSFRFARPGLQRVVYDQMEESRRRELHGAAADAMIDDEEALEPELPLGFHSFEEDLKSLRSYTPEQITQIELETFSFAVSTHVLTHFSEQLRGTVKAVDLDIHVGKRVRIGGWLISAKLTRTRKGDRMMFVNLDDSTGMIDVVLFPNCFAVYAHLMRSTGPFIVTGRVSKEYDVVSLVAERVELIQSE